MSRNARSARRKCPAKESAPAIFESELRIYPMLAITSSLKKLVYRFQETQFCLIVTHFTVIPTKT